MISFLEKNGASYVPSPNETNVDLIAINRNFFLKPSQFPHFISCKGEGVKFLGNSQYFELCCEAKRKLPIGDLEIMKNGGIILVDPEYVSKQKTNFLLKFLKDFDALFSLMQSRGKGNWKFFFPETTITMSDTQQEAQEEFRTALEELKNKKMLWHQKHSISSFFCGSHLLVQMGLQMAYDSAKDYRHHMLLTEQPNVIAEALTNQIFSGTLEQIKSYMDKILAT
eukprot:TRINITY_DN8872_c0_g1_i1.p1 TRINITY_DN8872_c0_g1~~TRINITY_DN8872_c0_g1_i1.p1  ORF type:complete len:241 (+),score=63.65 TRINITY_DN8872_c0_g1_i1:50-724(+)